VEFYNDADYRDVVVDGISVDGVWLEAEAESVNTGVWVDAEGQCGNGSYSEWLHCDGYIGFRNTFE
jgi:hypothetical protein